MHKHIDDFWLREEELANLSQNLPAHIAESLRKQDERYTGQSAKDLIEGLHAATIGYCAACWYLNSGIELSQLANVLQRTLATVDISTTLTTDASRGMVALALNDATEGIRKGSSREQLDQAWRRNAITGAWRIVNLRRRLR
jgi:hypothetical protein